jgi:predicted amidohydrolase
MSEPRPAPTGMERAGDLLVVERTYCDDASMPTVGLANIHAVVPGIEENKAKIEHACRVFKERGVNLAVFPEFCISGYFWEDEAECWDYMDQAVTELHLDWIDGYLRPLLDDTFRVIVLNNITRGKGRRFLNEELLIVHNIDVAAARRQEKDDFDYTFDFSEVYRPMDNGRGYTRQVPVGTETTSSEPT